MPKRPDQAHPDVDALRSYLSALNLPFTLENHQGFAQTAADKHWSHLGYLTELLSGEAAARDDRRVQRCIKLARFPVLKTLDQFDWNWPTKINRLLIQNLFHLDFVNQRANVVFISGTGLGKSHLMTAGTCRVPAWPVRSVYRGYRNHQHLERRALQRQYQTCVAHLHQT